MPLPRESPPETGLIEFAVAAAPVSFQAPGARKAEIVAAVRAAVANCEWVLSGDVKLEVRWAISVRARYEGDSSADVDNIVKPILDALCGPGGIMIDDCQVQELTCYWSGGYSNPGEQAIEIALKFDPDGWMEKEELVFLQVDRALYVPLHGNLPPRFVLEQAENFVRQFESARRMIELGATPYQAYLTLPIQRVFHRSKIGAFPITTLAKLRERFGGG